MISLIGAVLHAPPHITETWSPDKVLAYFDKAIEVQNILRGTYEEGA
jgi:hypothetical protein